MITIERYTSTKCGPCKVLGPIVESYTEKNSDSVEMVTLDVDQHRELAEMNNIRGIPTMIFKKDGVEVKRHTGVLTESQIDQIVKGL